MSLINDMLKDLEKRRSSDLETSESLSRNITWETRPNQSSFNWLGLIVGIVIIMLLAATTFLLWERTYNKNINIAETKEVAPTVISEARTEVRTEVKQPAKKIIKKETSSFKKVPVVDESENEEVAVVIDVDEIEETKTISVKKTKRPLNNKQLAEIQYNKGYELLQQGRLRQGKSHLREALSLYIPHIKAREMLAGIYIKSGHLINAAELLSEGVKVAPEYPLFAKLYARVLLEQNNPNLAITILEQGTHVADINLEPDYYALLAATYQRTNQHKKAIELYLRLVKIRSTAGVWWLGLAISLEKSGAEKEALEAYQRAQQTGSLNAGLVSFTNNKVSALSDIGFPE